MASLAVLLLSAVQLGPRHGRGHLAPL